MEPFKPLCVSISGSFDTNIVLPSIRNVLWAGAESVLLLTDTKKNSKKKQQCETFPLHPKCHFFFVCSPQGKKGGVDVLGTRRKVNHKILQLPNDSA